jgi:hypothetical protein
MKKIIFLSLAFLFSVTLFAQDPVFNWTNRNTKPNLEQTILTYTDQQGGYLLVNKMPPASGTFAPSITAEYFNANNERVYKKNCTVEVMEDFVDVVLLNNKAYVLKSLFKKEEGVNTLFAVPISSDGNYENAITLATIPAEKLSQRGLFSASCSDDGSKLIVVAEPNFIKDQNEKITLTLFNEKLEKIWKSEQTFSYPWTRAVFNQPHVNNAGTVYLLKKTDMKGEGITYSVFSCNGTDMKEMKMEFDGNKKAATLVSDITAEGDFLVGGYYTEDAKVKIGFGTAYHGSFVFKTDGKMGAWRIKTISPFEKRKDISARRIISYKGNTILTGEINYINSSARPKDPSIPASEQDPFARDYSYSAYDIWVDGFDAQGKSMYQQSIRKTNSSKNDFSRWNSFFGEIMNDKLYLIFMDDKTRYDEKKKWIIFGGVPKIPVYAILDPITGVTTPLKPVEDYQNPGNKEEPMLLKADVFIKLNEKECVIRAENGDVYRMGRVRF